MQKSLKLFFNIILAVTIAMAFGLFIREQFNEPGYHLKFDMPSVGVDSVSTAILVKRNDAFSIEVAKLYRQKRNISENNVFYIDLPDQDVISAEAFSKAYSRLKSQLPDNIQAMVATWQKPYRVDCMSITSALSFGFDKKWCQPARKGCHTTAVSPLFNSPVREPWTDLGIRPTMLLTGKSLKDVDELITRGVKADFSNPVPAKAFLVKTRDLKRSTRWPSFQYAEGHPSLGKIQADYLDLSQADKDYIENKRIFIYQTGLTHVPKIDTNDYLPGAVADHLTSFGGKGFNDGEQMKAISWLEAGATGTYGTVVEPCSYPSKFPNPNVLIRKYELGETLLDAYWKSVQMPGEGLFLGDPLARPFGVFDVQMKFNRFQIRTNRLDLAERYGVLYFDEKTERFKPVERFSVYVNRKRGEMLIQFRNQNSKHYKIARIMKIRPEPEPKNEKSSGIKR